MYYPRHLINALRCDIDTYRDVLYEIYKMHLSRENGTWNNMKELEKQRPFIFKRCGNGDYLTYCPIIHRNHCVERTPSFRIHLPKGREGEGYYFKCFGCGCSGDVFTIYHMPFYVKSFTESIDFLASQEKYKKAHGIWLNVSAYGFDQKQIKIPFPDF